eukprot:COSAG05_NODE_65_length_22456_cov_17.448540_11_plen_955_part_00
MVETVTFAVNQVTKGTNRLPCAGAIDFFSRLAQDIGVDPDSPERGGPNAKFTEILHSALAAEMDKFASFVTSHAGLGGEETKELKNQMQRWRGNFWEYYGDVVTDDECLSDFAESVTCNRQEAVALATRQYYEEREKEFLEAAQILAQDGILLEQLPSHRTESEQMQARINWITEVSEFMNLRSLLVEHSGLPQTVFGFLAQWGESLPMNRRGKRTRWADPEFLTNRLKASTALAKIGMDNPAERQKLLSIIHGDWPVTRPGPALVDPDAHSSHARGLLEGKCEHGFIAAIITAFDGHYPLALRPEHIWTLIVQGVATHIRCHQEELQSRFVKHEGKQTLLISRDQFVLGQSGNDWASVVAEFSEQLKSNTVADCKMLATEFSSTTVDESVCGQIVVMHLLDKFFDYEVLTCCGFPTISLEGSLADWKKLEQDAHTLVQSKCLTDFANKWLAALQPVLHRFVTQYENPSQVDVKFWQSMCKRGGELGSGGRTWLNGWFNVFFPYLKDWGYHSTREWEDNPYCVPYSSDVGYAQEKLSDAIKDRGDAVDHFWYADADDEDGSMVCVEDKDTKQLTGRRVPPAPDGVQGPSFSDSGTALPSGMVKSSVKWSYLSGVIPLEFHAGFVGCEQLEDGTIRPALGWFVRHLGTAWPGPKPLQYSAEQLHQMEEECATEMDKDKVAATKAAELKREGYNVGDVVEKRSKQQPWELGYVVSLNPLRVTATLKTDDRPTHRIGTDNFDEVRLLSQEQQKDALITFEAEQSAKERAREMEQRAKERAKAAKHQALEKLALGAPLKGAEAAEIAEAALDLIDKKELGEAKCMFRPPSGCEEVLSAVLVLLANTRPTPGATDIATNKAGRPRDLSWKAAQSHMKNVAGFIARLRALQGLIETDQVPKANFKHVRPFLAMQNFSYEILKKKSGPIAFCCAFVIAIVAFHDDRAAPSEQARVQDCSTK